MRLTLTRVSRGLGLYRAQARSERERPSSLCASEREAREAWRDETREEGRRERTTLMKGFSLYRAQARSERTSIEPMRKRASTYLVSSLVSCLDMFSLLTSRLFSRRASRLFTHLPRQSLLSRHSSLVSALSSLAPHLFSHDTTHKNIRTCTCVTSCSHSLVTS